MCIHSFISVTVDNSIFELSLMIAIIVFSALLVVTCAIAVSSVCIVIIVKCKKGKGKQSVRRKPPWRKNAMIKRGIATDSVQPEPPVYIEILPDLRAPRLSARKSGSSGSHSQTLPMSVPVRCTNPSNVDKTFRVHSLGDSTYVNVGVRRTATQTGVSKVSKPVPQPHQESDIHVPYDANEWYDTLQPREKEEEEEEEYIEMTSLRQEVEVNWNSAYRTLEGYNNFIVQN